MAGSSPREVVPIQTELANDTPDRAQHEIVAPQSGTAALRREAGLDHFQ
jgi:hypothetical protein